MRPAAAWVAVLLGACTPMAPPPVTSAMPAAPAAPDQPVPVADGARPVSPVGDAAAAAGEPGARTADAARADDAAPARDSAAPAAPVGRFAPLVPGGVLRFGADRMGALAWSGDFDRIRLHTRALTDNEVAAEAARQYTPCDRGARCVGDWTFDAGAGPFASAGGAGLAARAVGAVTTVAGMEGGAVRLGGGWLEVAADPALAFSDELTVSFWARRVSCASGRCLRGRLFETGGLAVDDFLDHSETYVTLERPGTFASDIDGGLSSAWTHIAVTFSPTALKIYRNGKLRRVHLPQGLVFPPLEVNDLPLRFGAGTTGGQPFPGDLDRIRLYGRALGPDEVAAHARKQFEPCAAASKCVSEWAFDGADGPLPAKLMGAAQLVDGFEGRAAHLLGGHVEVPSDPALALRDAFTYSVWVKRIGQCPTGLGGCGDERILDKGAWFYYELHEGGSRARINGKAFYCNSNPGADVWTHVALVFDATQGLRCYTNGRLAKAFVVGQPDNFCGNCNGP